MTFKLAQAYHARADHCTQQSHLSNDDKIKKFWDDLADDWLALEKSQIASAK